VVVHGASARNQIDEQLASNRSALGYHNDFAGHRERLTSLVEKGVASEAGLRLCVLGAGNCHDLDLCRLGAVYRELHLVDLDKSALERARSRQSAELQERIFCHAPLDLSGVLAHIERWAKMQVTIQELVSAPKVATAKIAEALPGPFDVVVSACVLTQMQLSVLNVLTDRHPLFEAVRMTVNLIHLRTLARLLASNGRALLVSDLTSNTTYPLDKVDSKSDLKPLMRELLAAGNVIYAAHPGLLERMWKDDPVLRQSATLSGPEDAWLWHNGPERVFLVYAMEIARLIPPARTPAKHDS
jgi:hypothetical protein